MRFIDINREKSVKIIMDQTDEMDNSIELHPDDFRNTYKSNFGKSDITSEFDFTVDGRFRSNNLNKNNIDSNLGNNRLLRIALIFIIGQEALSPFNIQNEQVSQKEQFPSMIQFNDYADVNEISKQKQTSKPFGLKKRTSHAHRLESNNDASFDPFRKSMGKESLNAQGSTIKRKNSQNESDILNEFKSEIMMGTKSSKFVPTGRYHISYYLNLPLLI